MPNTREIIQRRQSVSNICKITKTMEMIATSRFKKAHNRTVGSKPYTNNIAHLIASLAAGRGSVAHPLMRANRKTDKNLILVLTSNRGLCGGYNSNVLRLANDLIRQHKEKRTIKPFPEESKDNVDLWVSGQKGIRYFKFINQPVHTGYTDFDAKTTYSAVEALAEVFINLYRQRKITTVQIVYTRFFSASKFEAEVLNLLPLSSLDSHHPQKDKELIHIDEYIFSPAVETIVERLIPAAVYARLFQCFTDAIVSEQVARMRAMKAATDNAELMINNLTREYNRARQSQITSELLDIMGGVEAIK